MKLPPHCCPTLPIARGPFLMKLPPHCCSGRANDRAHALRHQLVEELYKQVEGPRTLAQTLALPSRALGLC
jgi:hypothetical protein